MTNVTLVFLRRLLTLPARPRNNPQERNPVQALNSLDKDIPLLENNPIERPAELASPQLMPSAHQNLVQTLETRDSSTLSSKRHSFPF